MQPQTKSVLAIALGVTAIGVLVCLDVMGIPIGTAAAGMLGGLAGHVSGYLVPSPGEQTAVLRALNGQSQVGPQP